MIGVKQTKRGGPEAPPGKRGNCFGACLASVFEVPMSQIPDPPIEADAKVHDSSMWWDHYRGVAKEHGYLLENMDDIEHWWEWMAEVQAGLYWIAAVKSLNILPTEAVPMPLHAVVMCDDKIVHDPSRAVNYTEVTCDEVVAGNFFVSLNPAR